MINYRTLTVNNNCKITNELKELFLRSIIGSARTTSTKYTNTNSMPMMSWRIVLGLKPGANTKALTAKRKTKTTTLNHKQSISTPQNTH
jgi:hypothetical protein